MKKTTYFSAIIAPSFLFYSSQELQQTKNVVFINPENNIDIIAKTSELVLIGILEQERKPGYSPMKSLWNNNSRYFITNMVE